MVEEIIRINYQKLKLEELSTTEQTLLKAALKATRQSYAPYSRFHVGAAVLMADGTILTGSNQENVAYPSGLCAERVTLFNASHQYPDGTIKALAITAVTGGKQVKMVTPCGACRQVMVETESRQKEPMAIYLYGNEDIYKIGSAADLLPLSFNM